MTQQDPTTGKLYNTASDDRNHDRISHDVYQAIWALIGSAWDNANDTIDPENYSEAEYERVAMVTLEMNLDDFPHNWPEHEAVKEPVRAWFESQFKRKLWRY